MAKTKPAKSNTQLRAAEIANVVASMNQELRSRYEQCRDLWAASEGNKVKTFYQIAQLITEVLDDETGEVFGIDSAKKLADAMDVSVATLSSYRNVVRSFEAEEIEKLSELKSKEGHPMSWTMLMELSRAGIKRSLRDKLIARFEKESLRVKDVVALVQAAIGNRGNNQSGRPRVKPHSPTAGLAAMHRFSQQLLDRKDDFEAAIFESLSNEPAKYATDELVDRLQIAYDDQRELESLAATNRKKLAAALDTAKRTLEAKAAERKSKASEGVKKSKKKSDKAKKSSKPKADGVAVVDPKKAKKAGSDGASTSSKKRSPKEAIEAARKAATNGNGHGDLPKKKKKKKVEAAAE